MSYSNSTTITQAGKITVIEGKKGIEFYAFNHEHQKRLHVGTLSGAVYEKTAPILRQPEPSFCLPGSELAAIEEAGGRFIRFIARGTVGTYAISLADFKLHGERYFARGYGYQTRVPLTRFEYSPRVVKRNPVLETTAPLIRRESQMSLFS
jgi:hypothetical protein